MKKVVKARKIHTCCMCDGNIQKGERYVIDKLRVPRCDENENQIGVEYLEFKKHKRDCFPRLINYEYTKEILKNCNYGVHNFVYDMNPESYDDNEYCKWCGIIKT